MTGRAALPETRPLVSRFLKERRGGAASTRAYYDEREEHAVSVELAFDGAVDVIIDATAGSSALRQAVAVRTPRRKARVAGVEAERFVLWEDYGRFPTTVTMLARLRWPDGVVAEVKP